MTMQATTLTDIKLPYPLIWQRKVLAVEGNICLFGGRRLGKTQVGVYKILLSATEKIGLYWWVGLSWRSASLKRAWRLLKFYVRKIWQALDVKDTHYIREADKELLLPNGSAIWMRTAERPDSLAGEGIRGAVVDEWSLMPEMVWTEYLEATLLDYAAQGSWVLFIGVPKGEHWSTRLWRAAAGRVGWHQFRFTTYDNETLSRESIDEIRNNATENIFNQEYLAEIIEDSGAVFKGLYKVCILKPDWLDVPIEDHLYVGGLDWGKQNDYTVLSIFDATSNREVLLFRLREIDFRVQINQVYRYLMHWKPLRVEVEHNGIGEMPFQELKRAYNRCEPFYTTQDTKELLITSFAHAVELTSKAVPNGVLLLDDPIGVKEMASYQADRLPSGRWKYGAQPGEHDDTVIARALAWQAKLNYRRYGGIHIQ